METLNLHIRSIFKITEKNTNYLNTLRNTLNKTRIVTEI